MASTKETTFFKDLASTLEAQRKALASINSNLRHYEIEEISATTGKGSLQKQFESNPKGVGAFGPIEDHIRESVKISESVDKYISDYLMEWNNEKIKAEELRKADRRSMWILWSQRLVRWALGGFVAVMLYSVVVWASEHSSFVKVPVRDLFHTQPSDVYK